MGIRRSNQLIKDNCTVRSRFSCSCTGYRVLIGRLDAECHPVQHKKAGAKRLNRISDSP